MAKYRHIHVAFWEDTRVSEEMTPEDKYFYMYLLTNPSTTQIGIYAITKKKIAFETGYSIESVKALMDRFENHHKLIRYNEDTREVAILNWPKYNLGKGGKPVLDCVASELKMVKNKSFINLLAGSVPNDLIQTLFFRHCALPFEPNEPDTFDESYNESSDDTPTTSGQKEKEKEKEKEKSNNVGQADNPAIPFSEIIAHLNQKTNSNYRADSKATQRLVKARWKEGYKLEDFKTVIDIKSAEWLNNPEMFIYLRPETLFSTKFESYLNQKPKGAPPNGPTQNGHAAFARTLDENGNPVQYNFR